jgi:hypothetical protein
MDEAILVRELRDRITWHCDVAVHRDGDSDVVQEMLDRASNDPDVIDAYRSSLDAADPSAAMASDEQMAARIRIDSHAVGPPSDNDREIALARAARWNAAIESELSDQTIAVWVERRASMEEG